MNQQTHFRPTMGGWNQLWDNKLMKTYTESKGILQTLQAPENLMC